MLSYVITSEGLNIIRSYIVFLSVIGALTRHAQTSTQRDTPKPAHNETRLTHNYLSGFPGLRAESEANETQKRKRRTYFLQEERMQKINNSFPKEIPLVPYLLEERK